MYREPNTFSGFVKKKVTSPVKKNILWDFFKIQNIRKITQLQNFIMKGFNPVPGDTLPAPAHLIQILATLDMLIKPDLSPETGLKRTGRLY